MDASTQDLYVAVNGSWQKISSYILEGCSNCIFFNEGKCLNPLMKSSQGEPLEVPGDYKCDDWVDSQSIYIAPSTAITSNYNSYNPAWSTFQPHVYGNVGVLDVK